MSAYGLAVTVLVFLLLGAAADVETNGRIVGGSEQVIRNAPWQVSIQISARHECGGVIYSKEIVITAGHCLYEKSVTLMKVRVGAQNHNYGGTLVPVAAYKVHEQFDSTFLHYDIAVLRLSTPLTFSLSTRPINLASKSPVGGSTATVTGWGYMENGAFADTLQKAQLQIIDRGECASQKFGYGYDFVGEETICAASSDADACTGDSGGPLVANSQLVGIVSWGYRCADDNYPGVYADVAILRPWIVKAANAI
ncbi:trypsin iota [Drosophila eugracilis]|uniref:trypsin iota n=1 Tax=Drosophila eugracilis TaxID=29029 RepID=UPI0007E86FBD|nr:trypsin iota [Drosophila eugracilis]